MNKQLIIGFASEGNTDVRFFESIIQRTFENVAFECEGQIEVLPVYSLKKETGDFNDVVKAYAKKADSIGIMVLCIHCDADDFSDKKAYASKIDPAFDAVKNLSDNDLCKNLVAIVPVVMTESWMLADTTLLKDEIGTQAGDMDLGIHPRPEEIKDPKLTIEKAIRIAREALPKRRRRDLTISELYSPIGQKINLKKLEKLPSYKKFISSVKESLRRLNYLHTQPDI